ncbi:MarR family transcriptional regulator [Pseudomonas aeruginosa]|uniref:MarR family winged helix-turn-helix transcriptional regulator n=1 Tax=Pseudomonas aeruginosa TaxID=287 RepID=UPI0010689D05|nr:MarR family transcriptional regulator [Pseudomonas aeruginosa]TEO63401.1 MarR family transcriptional regulator [Pseudomonas aeruginosa]TEO71885.1 MarR family transcriptional regulator [Pseudomonas aeruginosa]
MVESNKTAADTYSLAIFRAIRRLQQAAEIHSKRLSRYGGLTPLQLLILHVLAVEGELTATQLAKLVSLSQASLSGVLDRLEGRGLLYGLLAALLRAADLFGLPEEDVEEE